MKIEASKINWVGSYFADHSLAIVNRNISKYIQKNEQIELRHEIPKTERENTSKQRPYTSFDQPDLTISHQWPPIWSKPKSGKWVCMQPWEFGAVPREWYIPMKYWTDEIWVYSSYNKESYVRSGIPESKIHVISLGVDENVYNPDVEALTLHPSSFRFLFVGGTIGRKGIDILLDAYLKEFTADDDVCLFIKDTGTQSFYKGITLEKMILDAMANPKNPRIIYMDQQFSEPELAGLYKACDCLVHPYRGEGFGLPIAEAMACGVPVIVPDKGSCQDFCTEETALFVPSKEVSLSTKKVGNLDTVDFPWWLFIEIEDLQQVMRSAYENRTLVKEKGQKASKHILSSFTWEKSAQRVLQRIKLLLEKEPNRKVNDEDIITLELEKANKRYAEHLNCDALGTYLNILSIYPTSLMTRYNAAIVYLSEKNYSAAKEHLTYISGNMGEQTKDFQNNILQLLMFCYSKM